jgi:hypothetical protein
MRGGTKLYNLGARKLSPANTNTMDRGTLLGTKSPSDGDNKMLSPGGVSPSHSPTEMEYTVLADPKTIIGGGTRRHKRSRHKRSRHKRSRHKRSRHKRSRHKRSRHKRSRHKRSRHKRSTRRR